MDSLERLSQSMDYMQTILAYAPKHKYHKILYYNFDQQLENGLQITYPQ